MKSEPVHPIQVMKGVPGTICRREMQEGNKVGLEAMAQKIIEYGGMHHWTRIPEKGC